MKRGTTYLFGDGDENWKNDYLEERKKSNIESWE